MFKFFIQKVVENWVGLLARVAADWQSNISALLAISGLIG
jgi:hypothetical protein